jgi:hypothetical protein
MEFKDGGNIRRIQGKHRKIELLFKLKKKREVISEICEDLRHVTEVLLQTKTRHFWYKIFDK